MLNIQLAQKKTIKESRTKLYSEKRRQILKWKPKISLLIITLNIKRPIAPVKSQIFSDCMKKEDQYYQFYKIHMLWRYSFIESKCWHKVCHANSKHKVWVATLIINKVKFKTRIPAEIKKDSS